jgi:hypothetical protein
VAEFAAKDLLRAANLPLLVREEPHVEVDLKKIRRGNRWRLSANRRDQRPFPFGKGWTRTIPWWKRTAISSGV